MKKLTASKGARGSAVGTLRALLLGGCAAGATVMAAVAPAMASEQREGESAQASALAPAGGGTVTVTDVNGELVQIDFASLMNSAMGGGQPAARSSSRSSWSRISEGFQKIESTTDGRSLYGLWYNPKTQDLLAELPRGFERQRHFFAMTVSGGDVFAGLQAGDLYTYWKRYGEDRLALMAPQISIRSTGEQESRDSVNRLFTDRVLLEVPILGKGPNGQPVIDLDAMLLGNARVFFGGQSAGLNRRLTEVKTTKAFPENIEVAIEAPTSGGRLKTFHWSISEIRGTPGYKPRVADARVGYFVTNYDDLGEYDRDDVTNRYINRWHLEKADRRLKLSPPKEPIVFYVEHTVPVRYRRWVREGAEYWNKAFENVGIDGALEIRFQDKSTGAHMDKDPEDVRYNFIRWLNNDIATAIGPSRVNPMTGEILDADVVLTDGWIRVFDFRWQDLVGDIVLQGFDNETLAWLDRNPEWDPRIRLAPPNERAAAIRERQRERARGLQRFGGLAAGMDTPKLIGDDELDGLVGRVSQINGMCRAAQAQAMNLAAARVHIASLGALAPIVMTAHQLDPNEPMPELPEEMLEELRQQMASNPDLMEFVPPAFRDDVTAAMNGESEPASDDEGDEPAADEPKGPSPWDTGDTLDGMPEVFVGPMLAELVAHEVGHCLGLRHNFKGSSAYTLEEINSPEFKGNKPWSTTVMDYNGINIRMPLDDDASGTVQGDFSVIDIGPYDMFAIEYGYTFGNAAKVLERSTDPLLNYATDEDTRGPDPLARRYDLAKDPRDWARNQAALADRLMASILTDFVGDGEPWAKSRRGYRIALNQKIGGVSAMANWIGGAFVYRDMKGQEGGRVPIEVVPAQQQREALAFVINNTFYEESFGLTPELLRHLTLEKWYDDPGSITNDSTFNAHDLVLGTQASIFTQIMNPTTLRRVFDNEKFVDPGEDAFTLAELVRTVMDSVYTELDATPNGGYTDRAPMISTMRRNLQREVANRLVDLTLPANAAGAASKPIQNLAMFHLRSIRDKSREAVNRYGSRIDDLTLAHLEELDLRITQALDAEVIYNADDIGGGFNPFSMMFAQPAQPAEQR